MSTMASIASTATQRGFVVPPLSPLLLLLLLLTPPMVIYLTIRFQSWHELGAWAAHAGWIMMTPFREIAQMLHSHKPRHA